MSGTSSVHSDYLAFRQSIHSNTPEKGDHAYEKHRVSV